MSEPKLIALTAPYSEACMHLRVAGKPVLVEPRDGHMAQLYTTDGARISFPITRGEAGLHPTEDRPLGESAQPDHDEFVDPDELLDRLLLMPRPICDNRMRKGL